MNNKELVTNVREAVDGNLEATFKLILEFESVINQECKINGEFNQDCKDYIVDKLILKIKKFKKL
ncbi:MAG: helix-turn-helix domain-containing protein [Bacilli bacterium]|nr:helix-turn-helix domain-containing protein [Bacilli bacterium]